MFIREGKSERGKGNEEEGEETGKRPEVRHSPEPAGAESADCSPQPSAFEGEEQQLH